MSIHTHAVLASSRKKHSCCLNYLNCTISFSFQEILMEHIKPLLDWFIKISANYQFANLCRNSSNRIVNWLCPIIINIIRRTSILQAFCDEMNKIRLHIKIKLKELKFLKVSSKFIYQVFVTRNFSIYYRIVRRTTVTTFFLFLLIHFWRIFHDKCRQLMLGIDDWSVPTSFAFTMDLALLHNLESEFLDYSQNKAV